MSYPPGALSDPSLKIFPAGSTTPIAQNDNWAEAQPVNATQLTATAAEIAAASLATGAFPLGNASKDATVMVTSEALRRCDDDFRLTPPQ